MRAIIAAAALAALASQAAGTAADSVDGTAAKPAAAVKTRKICRTEEKTGNVIPKRVCRTVEVKDVPATVPSPAPAATQG